MPLPSEEDESHLDCQDCQDWTCTPCYHWNWFKERKDHQRLQKTRHNSGIYRIILKTFQVHKVLISIEYLLAHHLATSLFLRHNRLEQPYLPEQVLSWKVTHFDLLERNPLLLPPLPWKVHHQDAYRPDYGIRLPLCRELLSKHQETNRKPAPHLLCFLPNPSL